MADNGLYGVIFDMDGVLVHSYQPHFESWRVTAREYGRDLTEADFARQFGRTSREIIRSLWGESLSDDQIRAFDERKEVVYRELIREDIPAVPGVQDLLVALHEDGAKIAVGSSGPMENIDLVLDGLKIRRYFAAIVSGKDVARGKPEPDVFLTGARRIGVVPARCVVVEDAVPGIQAAHRAGMKCIALTTSHPRERVAEAEYIAADLREVGPQTVRALIGG